MSAEKVAEEKKERRARYLFERDDVLRAHRERRHAHPVAWLIGHCRGRAKQRGIEFTIVGDDIYVPERCPVLGIKLVRNDGWPEDNSPTIDRIDNSRGYVPGNVAVISYRANRLKNDANVEETIAILEYMRGRPIYG